MFRIFEAFLYLTVGIAAYAVAAGFDGGTAVVLAGSGVAPGICPEGDCCNPANSLDCCKESNENCGCMGYMDGEVCIADDDPNNGYYLGECDGSTCP